MANKIAKKAGPRITKVYHMNFVNGIWVEVNDSVWKQPDVFEALKLMDATGNYEMEFNDIGELLIYYTYGQETFAFTYEQVN
jgi:hypothetical protein